MAQLQGLLSSAGRACALLAYGHGLEVDRRLYVAVLAASSRRLPRVDRSALVDVPVFRGAQRA